MYKNIFFFIQCSHVFKIKMCSIIVLMDVHMHMHIRWKTRWSIIMSVQHDVKLKVHFVYYYDGTCTHFLTPLLPSFLPHLTIFMFLRKFVSLHFYNDVGCWLVLLQLHFFFLFVFPLPSVPFLVLMLMQRSVIKKKSFN